MCQWVFVARGAVAYCIKHITTGKTRKRQGWYRLKRWPLLGRDGGGGLVVDMDCGGQTVWGREKGENGGGGRDRKKKKADVTWAQSRDRSDAQHGTQAVVQVKKASLCDADDNAISPALSRPMGSAPRDIERQTLIRWVCVLQPHS